MEKNPTEDTLLIAESWLNEGREIAIATVIQTWGSSPRPSGSRLVVDSNSQFQGSVSGGCIEAAVISAALEVIHSRKAKILEFGVSNEMAWDVGLACGGKVKIYLEPVISE